MVIVNYGDKKGHMDGFLKTNLDLYKLMVKKKKDLIFIVSGREGEGKSVITAGILKYLDPTFNLDRCYLNGDEFLKALIDANEPFKAYMFDEGQEFTSRAAMTRFNKFLVQVLSKVRAKQLYIGICIPSFFELDKYAAIHRSSFLLNVYSKEGRRGYFIFWNWEKKKLLYLQGKKNYDFNCVRGNFHGGFTKKMFPFNEEDYNLKKQEAMDKLTEQLEEQQSRMKVQRDCLLNYLYEVVGLKQIEISEIIKTSGIPLNQRTISDAIKGYRAKVGSP
ncbi:MAG: hypothetical protein ACTSYG_10865 [Candidatus Heimdallarchaeota archaeon]